MLDQGLGGDGDCGIPLIPRIAPVVEIGLTKSQFAASPEPSRTPLTHFLLRGRLLRLQSLHKNLSRTRDVIAAELFRARAIAGYDGIQDSNVLA